MQKTEKIVNDIQTSHHDTNKLQNPDTDDNKEATANKRQHSSQTASETVDYGNILHKSEDDALKISNEDSYNTMKNISKSTYRANDWQEYNNENYAPYLDTQREKIIKYPRQHENGNNYRGFEYRVVTDRPLQHHSKSPKAYIAVSLIAPKPIESDEDLILENELRQLKPWPHRQQIEPYQMRWMKKSNKQHL